MSTIFFLILRGGGCASSLNVQKYGIPGLEDISFSIDYATWYTYRVCCFD